LAYMNNSELMVRASCCHVLRGKRKEGMDIAILFYHLVMEAQKLSLKL